MACRWEAPGRWTGLHVSRRPLKLRFGSTLTGSLATPNELLILGLMWSTHARPSFRESYTYMKYPEFNESNGASVEHANTRHNMWKWMNASQIIWWELDSALPRFGLVYERSANMNFGIPWTSGKKCGSGLFTLQWFSMLLFLGHPVKNRKGLRVFSKTRWFFLGRTCYSSNQPLI